MNVWDFESSVFQSIYTFRYPVLENLSLIISFFGDGWLWVVFGLLLVLATDIRRQVAGYACLLALILSGTVVELILKPLIDRARPYIALENVELLGNVPFGASFPSGHVTTAAAIAWILAFAFPRWRLAFLLIPFVMGWSRMYNGAHWPVDVIAGYLLGALIGWLSLRIVRTVIKYSFRQSDRVLPDLAI